MNRRILPVVVAAMLSAVLLTGCTEIGAISEQAGIDLALDGLVSELKVEHGVTAAPATQMDAEFRYTVTVVLDPAGITPTNRAAVITAADETLGSSAFGSATVNLVIGEYEYTQAVFGLDTLAGDLTYWAEVEHAVGPVTFGIFGDPDGDGPQTRARNIYSPGVLDYSDLQNIELDDTALDTWGSRGIDATGGLPGAAATAALADLTAMIPLRDFEDPNQALGLGLQWASDPEMASWTLMSASLPEEAIDPTASADWDVAVQVATRVAAGEVGGSGFGYYSPYGLGGYVNLGRCASELSVAPGDEALFAGLVAAGVPLPPGSAPGWCSGP